MSYTHLSPEERYYIEISLKNEIGLAEIAASLERPQSTISREINRNTGRRGYRHWIHPLEHLYVEVDSSDYASNAQEAINRISSAFDSTNNSYA